MCFWDENFSNEIYFQQCMHMFDIKSVAVENIIVIM